MKRFLALLIFLSLLVPQGVAAQQASTPPPAKTPSAEFLQTADEVLAEMSKLLSLPVLAPLKKSIRTREEIRAYVLQRMKEDKEPAKRYADQKVLEKLGLIPKDFNLETFLVDLLTEQIAGLYDPKGQEFFIADWIPLTDQRAVMAHELTHALQDQHFHVDPWLEAAKPNDDAELARDAVLEGSALAAMLDYMLRGQSKNVRDLGDMDAAELMGDGEKSPQLAKAPPYLRDELLFPYVAGTTFTQHVLRASTGWADFPKVFAQPPVSTQQILHPDLYLSSYAPKPVSLPDLLGKVPADFKKLDENILGEFGVKEILKQFLGENRAARLALAWSGDRYAIFENQKNKQLLLVVRLRLASDADAARFFGGYSEALELRYEHRRDLFRRPNYFSFHTPEGGVFLRCVGDQCLSAEGTTREVFDKITRAIGWPGAPAGRPDLYRIPPRQKTAVKTAGAPPGESARALQPAALP